MNLIGILPVRNESWVLGLSARVALRWCDRLVILEHACDDGSERIIDEIQDQYPERVTRIVHRHECWTEMAHRQQMLEQARRFGATHIAMIDADEILTGNLVRDIRRSIKHLQPGQMLSLPGYNLRGGLEKYHADGVWGHRWFSTAFRDQPEARWSGDRQHSREPEGVKWDQVRPIGQGGGGVVHLWGASERRLIAKHALYKINETLKPVDKRDYKTSGDIDRAFSWAIKGDTQHPYRNFGTPETWTYSKVPDNWWFGYKELMKYLDIDAEPWQAQQVRELLKFHGKERFHGLDLFGVDCEQF